MKENHLYTNINEINNKINSKTQELIKLIEEHTPYDVICNIFIYVRHNLSFMQDDETLLKNYELKYQFIIEFLYGLITCINEKDFKNKPFKENNIYEIINKCDEISNLRRQALDSIMFLNQIDSPSTDYIFDDLVKMDFTGKRYDIFEKNHHKNTLRPLFNYIKEKYHVDKKDLLNGIKLLKKRNIFGFDKAKRTMEMVMNNNKDNDIDNLSEDDKNAFRNAMSEMFRLDLFDVTKITNWPVEFIEIFSADVGENTVSLEFVDFLKMIKIQNIINQKPIIKLENNYYCIRQPRLLDNFDKILLKQLYKDYSDEKQEIIKEFSKNIEDYTKKIFSNIFGMHANYYQNNFYRRNGKWIENDLLIEIDNYLFIIEIKSGNFTPDLAYENIESHIETLNNLVSKAGKQITEFENELLGKDFMNIYCSNKKGSDLKIVLNKNKYIDIFKMAITFESFNEIAARAEKIGLIKLNQNIIVCSIDDLEVYADYFKNQPVNFINYISNRTIATQNNLINLNDELDHLGLYITYNCYSKTVENISKEYKDVKLVIFEDCRSFIDDYYNGKYYGNKVQKPTLNYSKYISKIIDYLNKNNIRNGMIVGNSIISFSGKVQERLEANIKEMLNFFRINHRGKYLALGVNNYLLIVSCFINYHNDYSDLLLECYANLKLSDYECAYATLITFDNNENISNIEIRHITKRDYQYLCDSRVEEFANFIKIKRQK